LRDKRERERVRARVRDREGKKERRVVRIQRGEME